MAPPKKPGIYEDVPCLVCGMDHRPAAYCGFSKVCRWCRAGISIHDKAHPAYRPDGIPAPTNTLPGARCKKCQTIGGCDDPTCRVNVYRARVAAGMEIYSPRDRQQNVS